MKAFLTMLLAVMTFISAEATVYNYSFTDTPVSDALVKISKEHPEIAITFIYKELDNYTTSATVRTENPYEALRRIIGHNPISIIRKGNEYYIEALQHGKFVYTGRAVGSDDEPVAAATVMLLAPKDSTVLTYAVADSQGRFSIPCDSREVIAKLSCIGYHTVYRSCSGFNIGTVIMPVNATQLGQVKVEAQAASAYPDRTVYIPNNRQKNASQNATDLLRQMAISQIYINPEDNSVSDNTGGEVAIFFNYMPATQEDIVGLRTPDVRRVEYLEFPTDPRFRGAQRVINFIIQEYEYGGYTKITPDENFLVGLSSRANIFSKFSYKKMTYDLFVAANNTNNHHDGYDVEGVYSLKDVDGIDYTVNRYETVDNVHSIQNQYPVTFRASYDSEKVQVRNTLGYSHSANPVQAQSGSLVYSPSSGEDYSFSRSNSSRSNSFSYNGSFYFALPKDFSINVTPQFSHSHNNNLLFYATSTAYPILRKARENSYSYRLDAFLSKRIGHKHTLFLGINDGTHINKLRYTGNAVYSDHFQNPFAYGQLGYQFQTNKVNLYADAGVIWEKTDINGIKNNDTYPCVHISFRYTLNRENAFSSYFQFANNTPGIESKASDLLRDNEYMYITGNPHLNNSRHISFNMAYTWLPSNMFNMSVYGKYFGLFERAITAYEPYDNGSAVLRTYINDGEYAQGEIGIAAILNLLNKSLQLYVSPTQKFYRSTGFFDKSFNPFQVTAQATYYLKQWYFQAYYQSAQKFMFEDSPVTYKSRDFYSISAGWANADWNIRLTANNIFNFQWDTADRYIQAPLYSEHRTTYGTNSHARLNLSVTYTFGYGKKVQRGNEVGEQRGAASAIIK